VVVSFAAGGNADIVQRLQAEAMSKELGVPVNVVNKPGGAHIPATMSVLEAPADGYTIFNWSPPSFMIVPLTREVPYSPLDDFIPLFASISASNALYVRADSPVKAGTPQPVIDKLLAAAEVLGTAEFQAQLPKSVGYHWVHGPEGVRALIQEGVDLYSPILDGLGLLHKK